MGNVRVLLVPENIRTKQEIFSFFSRELSFPEYFSDNWDSFDEIINDLSWISESRIDIVHADVPLRSSPTDLGIYIDLLLNAFSASEKIHSISFEKERA